jgi:two-component system, chemotaxis family, CheB/CheR fusion protein
MPNAPKKSKKKPVRQESRAPGKLPDLKIVSRSTSLATYPIVAVGASAGGLEAFSNLLRALPSEPGMALVFIPHLDPTHESAMVELLSRITPMPVVQATEGMPADCNSVYVLPPHADMTISNGVLHLEERDASRRQHMPVDTFFRSLAEDQMSNAVGVVLSGTANDGTLGLLAIKGSGGITFAQDSQSAKYDGMPHSAVASGVVDFVLPPVAIAKELVRLQMQPTKEKPSKDVLDGNDRQLKEIFRLLKSVSKVDFVDYKLGTIRRRILRRMNINHSQDLDHYVKLLQRNPQEVEALYRDVLINVTSFFRNPDLFDSLREVVYPKMLADRSSSEPIRIWVPGCSTGEETYSHAISLVEMLTEMRVDIPVQIFGTDLSDNVIQQARAGIYKEGIASEVSEVRLRRFFHKVSNGNYQVSKAIRDICVFARQNVFSDPPFSRMDLISCRNVLIYLSPLLQKKVIAIFHYALKQGGFLLVGNTEGVLGTGAEIFDPVDRKNKIFQKKAVPSPVTFGLAMSAGAEPQPGPEKQQRGKEEAPRPAADVQREADRLLLTKYVPSAVVVNDDLEILQSRGRTNRFLQLPTGRASLNLIKMARPGLLYELRALIDQARKNGVPASKDEIVIEDGSESITVHLEVVPFRSPARDQRYFLVLFEEKDGRASAEIRPTPPLPKELADAKDVQLAQLKQELASTKEYLQSIIEAQEATNEELQSANEEIQSGNEELQSTNEELQTSKEELESANEELNTVNDEIQHRNQQLAQLSNDLINLLNSATIPMVMLGEDLHIRRCTPEAERVFGFSDHDMGKALTHLSLHLELPQLERWMLDVMRDVNMKSERVQSRDGKSYKLRITPYRTLENKIDGVVLTLLDISDLVPPRA